MTKKDLGFILNHYGVENFQTYKIIDSTNENDYRMNIIIDNTYVLRINDSNVITEKRLSEIDQLSSRYREIDTLAPKLYKNKEGSFSTKLNEHICYLSDYIDFPTADSIENESTLIEIRRDVMRMIGKFSAKFSGVNLSEINSMWSIIDLSPLDTDVDEKQENLDMLTNALKDAGEETLASDIEAFNTNIRERIKKVFYKLPRCVIQGDLNETNLLVRDGHFAGLIDFNMAGTEVNINHFCCETNYTPTEKEFSLLSAEELYKLMLHRQDELLKIILSEYTMNSLEAEFIEDFKSICLISQYPNVIAYTNLLGCYKDKILALLKLIIHR